MDAGGQSGPARWPSSLRAAAALVALEGLALLVLGVGYVVSGLVGDPEDRLGTLVEGVAAAVVGLALLPVARGLGRGRSWAVAPVVVVQLLVVVVGVGLLQGGVAVVGLPLLLVGVAVLAALAAPDTRGALRGDAGDS